LLVESVGVYKQEEDIEELMDYNVKVICPKHQKYWRVEWDRLSDMKITMCCAMGGNDCKNCGMEDCQHECHKRVNNSSPSPSSEDQKWLL